MMGIRGLGKVSARRSFALAVLLLLNSSSSMAALSHASAASALRRSHASRTAPRAAPALRLYGGAPSGNAAADPKLDLWEAARDGDLAAIDRAIEAGADAGSHDSDEMTALHHAAAWGQVQCCSRLVSLGAPLMARACDGSTALHLAAYYGHVDASKVLLDCGADVHGKDKDGSSPLHNAAFKGNGAVLSLLIERGADVLAKQDSNGMTGLHLAAEGGYLEAIKLLLEAGADPTIVSSSGASALDLALRSGGDASFDIAACLLSKIGGTRVDAAQIRRTVRLAGSTLAQVRGKRRSTFAGMPSVVTWISSPRRLASPSGVASEAAGGGGGGGITAKQGDASGGGVASVGHDDAGGGPGDKSSPAYLDEMMPRWVARECEKRGWDKALAKKGLAKVRPPKPVEVRKKESYGVYGDLAREVVLSGIAVGCGSLLVHAYDRLVASDWCKDNLFQYLPPRVLSFLTSRSTLKPLLGDSLSRVREAIIAHTSEVKAKALECVGHLCIPAKSPSSPPPKK